MAASRRAIVELWPRAQEGLRTTGTLLMVMQHMSVTLKLRRRGARPNKCLRPDRR
jgi:hypothetical protein